MAPFKADKGNFDAVFGALGNGAALAGALEVTRPGGTIGHLRRVGGEMLLPMNVVMAKAINLHGAFPFHPAFARAVAIVAAGTIDISAAADQSLFVGRPVRALDVAADRTRAMEVQLAL